MPRPPVSRCLQNHNRRRRCLRIVHIDLIGWRWVDRLPFVSGRRREREPLHRKGLRARLKVDDARGCIEHDSRLAVWVLIEHLRGLTGTDVVVRVLPPRRRKLRGDGLQDRILNARTRAGRGRLPRLLRWLLLWRRIPAPRRLARNNRCTGSGIGRFSDRECVRRPATSSRSRRCQRRRGRRMRWESAPFRPPRP